MIRFHNKILLVLIGEWTLLCKYGSYLASFCIYLFLVHFSFFIYYSFVLPPGQIPPKVPSAKFDLDESVDSIQLLRGIKDEFNIRFEIISPYHSVQVSI